MSRSDVTVKSFTDVLLCVRRQTEAECFTGEMRVLSEELCMIIAEIYVFPPDMQIRIGGESIPCGVVAQIYSRLTGTHLQTVMENFLSVDYPIKRKKAYLRAALYNSVFELESGEINSFRSSFYG